MELKAFVEKVQKSICEFFGDEARVEVKEVIKNNGVTLQGMVINREDETVVPTIYLNTFFEEYRHGKEMSTIICEIIEIYEQNRVTEKVNLDFFLDYQAVKGRIFQKVIHYEKNRKMLENVPHLRFLDLAVVCYYAYMNDFFGRGSIQIETGHLDKWGISQEELFENAGRNTTEKLGMELKGMEEVLLELISQNMDMTASEELQEAIKHAERDIPMHIMTVRGRYFGAVCIFHKEMLRFFAQRCGGNFFILPSSIHELILIPDSGRERVEDLKQMVKEVNEGHVAAEERLSDNVYYFNVSANKVTII